MATILPPSVKSTLTGLPSTVAVAAGLAPCGVVWVPITVLPSLIAGAGIVTTPVAGLTTTPCGAFGTTQLPAGSLLTTRLTGAPFSLVKLILTVVALGAGVTVTEPLSSAVTIGAGAVGATGCELPLSSSLAMAAPTAAKPARPTNQGNALNPAAAGAASTHQGAP